MKATALRTPGGWPLSAAWLICLGVAFHCVLAFAAGLSPDEAHYALYGAHPDWSYFDHPPLVGWLQAPFAAAGGVDFLMRLVPMASWIITVRLTIRLCRRLPLERVAVAGGASQRDGWVALMLLLSPLLNLLGVALVPDTLLMPLVPAVMLATWNLKSSEMTLNWRRWAVLCVLLGLCGLAKYTGIFIMLGALLSLSVFHGWRLIRMPGTWLTTCGVLAIVSPVFVWNHAHQWASFAYQSGHAAGDQAWQLRTSMRAIALQLALYGLLLPVALMQGLRLIRQQAREPVFQDVIDMRTTSLLFGVPVLLVFAVMAGRGSSLPHWTACGWMALTPLAVYGGLRLGKAVCIVLALLQSLLLVGILALVLAGGLGSEPGAAEAGPPAVRTRSGPANPVADLYGWESAALHAAGLAERRRARGLVVMNWSLASRLAWYARPMPVFVAPDRQDQFQLWFGALQPGDSAVVVDWSQMPLALPTGQAGFRQCSLIESSATIVGQKQIAHFDYWYCEDWQSGRRIGAPRQEQWVDGSGVRRTP